MKKLVLTSAFLLLVSAPAAFARDSQRLVCSGFATLNENGVSDDSSTGSVVIKNTLHSDEILFTGSYKLVTDAKQN